MSKTLTLRVEWSGPHRIRDVQKLSCCGTAPTYDGNDYGIYQIYGRHIIAGRNALLYVGRATEQTFAMRFHQHSCWLQNEFAGIRVHVGRIYDSKRHLWAQDHWSCWDDDVCMVERILIYKYSPHYNSFAIAERPTLSYERVTVEHQGARGRLRRRDSVPQDW